MTAGDDLRKLAEDMRAVNVAKTIGPVLSKAGANMRDRARQEAPAGPYLPAYQRSIIFQRPDPLSVEVGAMAAGQGNLSAVLEFGQGRNAPHPHILPQLDTEVGPTADWIGKVIAEAI